MTDAQSLIERLRDGTHCLRWGGGSVPEPECDEFVLNNPDGPEAADEIERLNALVSRLEGEIARNPIL